MSDTFSLRKCPACRAVLTEAELRRVRRKGEQPCPACLYIGKPNDFRRVGGLKTASGVKL